MPFETHGNRSFTWISIGNNAPAASGVYGLADASRWLYVGETANIQAELQKHLQSPSGFLKDNRPSGFTYELAGAETRVDRQRQLVFELNPSGNSTR